MVSDLAPPVCNSYSVPSTPPEIGRVDALDAQASLLVRVDVWAELELCTATGDREAERRAGRQSAGDREIQVQGRGIELDLHTVAVALMPLMLADTSVPVLRVETALLLSTVLNVPLKAWTEAKLCEP